MIDVADIDKLSEAQVRQALAAALEQGKADAARADRLQILNDKYVHELAVLRRIRFGARSEQFDANQRALFDEEIDADLEAIKTEREALSPPTEAKQQPKRAALPAQFPRTEIRHEPERTDCACGCAMRRIGEDISERLDYTPGVFTVERHIRGKWACARCERIAMAPMPAHVIDKGIPSAGLLAQVLTAKYMDHLPLYRQEAQFGRAGLAIPRSTLADWVGRCGVALAPLAQALRELLLQRSVLHADETPIQRLAPGKGKTHRAYLWAYACTPYDELQAVVYQFADGRSGEYARQWLGSWRGTLITDDYTGYKALFARGVIEAGCMAHARRKFDELGPDSTVGTQALQRFASLYKIERAASGLEPEQRQALRIEMAEPQARQMHAWLTEQRTKVKTGTATARAIDYSLRRWQALTRYLNDAAIPIDNNHIENRIRPIAVGKKNWLFVGSERAGERAAAVMTLVNSARLNGLDPHVYLKDVLERLPTTRARDIETLLPHRWATSLAP